MPRAFLIKKKQSAFAASARPLSPKLYSPTSSGISSPISSTASTSSSSPRNDENELATFQTSSPKYSFDRESSQCLDLSMKSLLKEANNLNEKSIKMEFANTFNTPLFQEPHHFVSGYTYPGKFAKIADFLRTREMSKAAFAPANVSPLVPSPPVHLPKNIMAPQVSPATASSLYKPSANYSSIENSQSSCNRLAPYSINWSEHFSVNKLVSPTPSSHGSDDSGRGSEHSEDMSLSESNKYGKVAKKSDRYQCPDCNKSYSTQSGLAKHQEFHCSSQVKKSFSCKHCEKVYVSLGALKMHIRTHTLPCKCKLCGKAFSRPWLLQGHIRTHTGEKPFACQYCNRAFADRSNLRAHLQTHSVVKKYNCKTCSRTFSRMSLLLKHEDNGCNAASRSSLSSCSPVHMEH